MKSFDLNIRRNPDLFKNIEKVVVIRNLSHLVRGFADLVYIPYKRIRNDGNVREGVLDGLASFISVVQEEGQNVRSIVSGLVSKTVGN